MRRVGRLHRQRPATPRRSPRPAEGVRVRAPPGCAGSGASRRRAQPRRDRLHQGEPALLSEQGACGAPARVRRDRQQRVERARVHLRSANPRQEGDDPHSDRRAASCLQPVRTSADERRDRRAHRRRVPAAHRGARAARRRRRESRGRRHRRHHESAYRRDSRDGERADVQSQRVPRIGRGRPPQPCRAGPVRAGVDVQSRDRVGRARRKSDVAHLADQHEPGTRSNRIARRARERGAQLRRVVARPGDRDVEQRRRDQDWIQGRHRASQPVRQPVRIRPSGVARLSRRKRGHRMESREVDRERTRIGVDGVSGRRHAAPDDRGGQLGRQRRRPRRAARHPGGVSRRPPLRRAPEGAAPYHQPRHRSGAHVDHGRRCLRQARYGASRTHRRIHHRRKNRNGREAGQRPLLALRVQRLVRRIHPLARSGSRDRRRHRRTAWPQPVLRRHGVRSDFQADCGADASVPRRAAVGQPGAAGAGRQP